MKSLSQVWLFATPWTIACQAPLFMGFSRQGYWSGLPFPSPEDLPDAGIEPGSPILQADAWLSEPAGKPAMATHSSTLAWKIPRIEEPWLAAVHGVARSQTSEQLHFHFSLSCIGEGNGTPLQCSCLENPRGRGAWWAAVYGVTQSRTRLSCRSSSSSSSSSSRGTLTYFLRFYSQVILRILVLCVLYSS